jgi:ubiquinone/menaquinone biosynthesis C-methylase UbiE
VADSGTVFTGSIPELYDRYLGPVLFEPYAEDLAQRVASRAGDAVLETACGTGRLTRQLRKRLPTTARLVATDLNQPMIDRASGQVEGDIAWQQADCAALPFPPGSFSALANQFGMMFVPNKAQALREARRVLMDGGLLAFSVWGRRPANPYAELMHETIASFFPDDPPRFLDVPFGSHDVQQWTSWLSAAGFGELEHEVVTLEAQSPTARDLAVGQIQGSPLSHEIRARGGDFDRVIDAVTDALVQQGGEAPFRSMMQAVVLTARAA